MKFFKTRQFMIWFKGFTTRQFFHWEKTFPKSYWRRHVFILRKHNTSDFQLKILQLLRDELTCGSFQLYIWRLNLQQTLSFKFFPYNKVLLTLTEKTFIQSEHEKKGKTHISEKRILKLLIFWIQFF